MIVRTVTPDDADKLYALLREFHSGYPGRAVFEPYFAEALAQPHRRIAIAYDNGQPVAFADTQVRRALDLCAPVGVIHAFFVREEFRRKGIGTGLLMNVNTWFQREGCAVASAACARVNVNSQNFLERRGYNKIRYGFVKKLE